MRTASIILITMCLSFSAISQGIDKKSEAILSDLSSKTKAHSSLKIEFLYKMENKSEGIDEKIDGVLFMKNDMYALEFGEQLIVSDGKTVWTYLKDVNEVQIGDADIEDEGSISPQSIFNLYEKGHRNKYMREGTYDGIKVHVIELVPLEPQVYHKVRLNINKDDNTLVSAVIFDRNQNTFTYEIKKQQVDLIIQDSRFKFNVEKYPGIEIIDLR